MRVAAAGLLILVAVFGVSPGVHAQSAGKAPAEVFSGSNIPVPGRYATTGAAYWKVGAIDRALSLACQRGTFNQIEYYRLNIAYRGKIGAGVTGIAAKGWNLRDPAGLAEPDMTYHFFDDGYSNCKVFKARQKGRR